MVASEARLPESLRLLADATRLRILGILERQELSVGDLSRSLGMAQSRVSNHLRLLRRAGLIAERHSGSTTYLHIALPIPGDGLGARLWQAVRGDLDGLPEHGADLLRLEQLLAARGAKESEFFDRLARDWDKIALEFASGQARQRAVASLLSPHSVVADLGSGTGYLARALVGLCRKVICVDRSRAMLDEARRNLAQLPCTAEVEFRLAELDLLPIADGELDGAVAAMVFHHLPSFERPAAEMLRALRPGGVAAVLELAPHRETWMQAALGDRHLGLEAQDVARSLEHAGFEGVTIEPIDDHYQPPSPGGETVQLPLYLVRAIKPWRAQSTSGPRP